MPGASRPRVAPSPITPGVRAFLTGSRLVATLATLGPDGTPHVAVTWFRLDPDGAIVVSSATGRRWPADLRADARVAISVIDAHDPYRWVGIDGVVEAVVDDQAIAQADIAGLARHYHADDPARAERLIAEGFTRQHRVTFRIRPLAVHDERD